MKHIKVKTQKEFDACIKAGNFAVVVGGRIEVTTDVQFENAA